MIDEGIGIRAERRMDVFTLFKRVNSTVEGHGIGLGKVARTVHRLGGRVGAEEAPGGAEVGSSSQRAPKRRWVRNQAISEDRCRPSNVMSRPHETPHPPLGFGGRGVQGLRSGSEVLHRPLFRTLGPRAREQTPRRRSGSSEVRNARWVGDNGSGDLAQTEPSPARVGAHAVESLVRRTPMNLRQRPFGLLDRDATVQCRLQLLCQALTEQLQSALNSRIAIEQAKRSAGADS